MIKHELRCVLDGRTVHYDDDGHQKGDPTRPMAKRQALANLLEKKAPDEGPAWAFVKQPQGFTHNRLRMAAPSGPVWDEKWDERLEMFASDRKARAAASAERVASGNPTEGALAKERAQAESKDKDSATDPAADKKAKDDAKKAKAAADKKAKDDAKGEG